MDKILPLQASSFGSTLTPEGVFFSVFAWHADAVTLCLFDSTGSQEKARLPLFPGEGGVWQGFLPGGSAGTVYGYRAEGKWAPQQGLYYNSQKLLLDPWAKKLAGSWKYDEAVYPYRHRAPELDAASPDGRDSAPFVAKAMVIPPTLAHSPGLLQTPWEKSVILEAHIRGLTMRHPKVREPWRGKYLALTEPALLDDLLALGITAIELLPVMEFLDEPHLQARGLVNYWGYNPIAFFCPARRYAVLDAEKEFQAMVRALHERGIEVILDVVFNHTAEGNHLGPMYSMKGLDNLFYYHMDAQHPGRFRDFSGCGNTLQASSPPALTLLTDAMRHWVLHYGVDGFRFDLATALAREGGGWFDPGAAFLDTLRQDPMLSQIKLIAEPWDLGDGGWGLGAFPAPFREWNGRFRDIVRGFWRGDEGLAPELGGRITGSQDIFAATKRPPTASLNFITCHDGFTLHDLVSYNHKHNEMNGEGNRDGTDYNLSWNCGAEGETPDPEILRLRQRQKKNLLSTLLLSQGVPMLLAGDERGHTQRGNNNAYCQDNPLTWIIWEENEDQKKLREFTSKIIALRKKHPALHRISFFSASLQQQEALWFCPDGTLMSSQHWQNSRTKTLGFYFTPPQGEEGEKFLWIFNATETEARFVFPEIADVGSWIRVFDTASGFDAHQLYFTIRESYRMVPKSTALFRTASEEEAT